MAEVLDVIELKQLQVGGVANDVKIGQALGVEPGVLQGVEAMQELTIELTQLVEAGRTVVVPDSVQAHRLVHVVARGGRGNR